MDHCTTMTEDDKKECVLAEDNIKQIENIYNENLGYKRKLLLNYCIIGRNVNYLKKTLKMSDKQLDKQLLKKCKGLSRANRNQYIKLHKLSEDYSNIIYVNVAFRDIVKYFKYLPNFLAKDKDFWQN